MWPACKEGLFVPENTNYPRNDPNFMKIGLYDIRDRAVRAKMCVVHFTRCRVYPRIVRGVRHLCDMEDGERDGMGCKGSRMWSPVTLG